MTTMTDQELRDRMLGCLYGGIVADAFGAPYEFRARDTFEVTHEMEYVDTFDLPAGSFTDDGSMMLCLAKSLIVCSGCDGSDDGFVPLDQMTRYAQWRVAGYMSSAPHKKCFDIGNTTSFAIDRFVQMKSTGKLSSEKKRFGRADAPSNGGIMRLGPVPVRYVHSLGKTLNYAHESCATTHFAPECLDCAIVMAYVIHRVFHGATKEQALDLSAIADHIHSDSVRQRICQGGVKFRDQISTSGHVVDTLEAALWAFLWFDSYQQGVEELVSMGNDTDTVACVYGQIAGAYYGLQGIPTWWLSKLQRRDVIDAVFEDLVNVSLITQ